MGGWASSASSCWSVGARGGGPRQIPVFQVRVLRAIDESLANTVRSNMAIQRALLVVVTSLVLLLSGATLVFAHAQLTSAAPPRVNCSLCASSRARAAANPARALGRAAVELGGQASPTGRSQSGRRRAALAAALELGGRLRQQADRNSTARGVCKDHPHLIVPQKKPPGRIRSDLAKHFADTRVFKTMGEVLKKFNDGLRQL
jgi:hypothetical protein